jgi:hypothetical protein
MGLRCGYSECTIRQICTRPTICRGDRALGWTGPLESDFKPDGTLRAPVPIDRWPFGSPSYHESGCGLHARKLSCDCAARETAVK